VKSQQSQNRRELISKLLAEEEREIAGGLGNNASIPTNNYQWNNEDNVNRHQNVFLKHERNLSGFSSSAGGNPSVYYGVNNSISYDNNNSTNNGYVNYQY